MSKNCVNFSFGKFNQKTCGLKFPFLVCDEGLLRCIDIRETDRWFCSAECHNFALSRANPFYTPVNHHFYTKKIKTE